ncbi:hypothetical protein DQ04_08921040 [Trypanosoma grayi]|uniref:hypothetical protein n=1 Tax=Trypanosoma grayi TaxID=71804 RepID=UPI0004F42006|nr:hypothetical protein DQ04_08921040 [Trypanosoma grayi]KEG07747.1 hypothetical protein DQ04_08921040 [Trypanosoma grayi]
MEHVLHLAEYCCGVGKGCKWSRSECKGEDAYKLNAADSAMTAASPAVIEEGAAAAAEKDAEMSAPSDDRKAAAELEFLDLSGSCLTESQALWLGTIIFHPRCSLRRVDLCECGLGNAGLRALLREAASSPRLGDAVVGVTPLDVLALRWNGVTEDESFGGILNRLDESTCNMYLEVHGNYLSSSVQRRLADREAKMMPIVVAQRRARRAEAKVVQNAQEHRKQEQQQKPEQLEPSSSCYALGLLLSIDENPPSSLPSLHLLASLLYARE